jgi:hypothetical protein
VFEWKSLTLLLPLPRPPIRPFFIPARDSLHLPQYSAQLFKIAVDISQKPGAQLMSHGHGFRAAIGGEENDLDISEQMLDRMNT